jgi:hypothetical protein
LIILPTPTGFTEKLRHAWHCTFSAQATNRWNARENSEFTRQQQKAKPMGLTQII